VSFAFIHRIPILVVGTGGLGLRFSSHPLQHRGYKLPAAATSFVRDMFLLQIFIKTSLLIRTVSRVVGAGGLGLR